MSLCDDVVVYRLLINEGNGTPGHARAPSMQTPNFSSIQAVVWLYYPV